MDLSAIKQQVMFQIGGDAEDVQDFLPYLTHYINDGYDRLALAAHGSHVGDGKDDYPELSHDRSTPMLPEWTHPAAAGAIPPAPSAICMSIHAGPAYGTACFWKACRRPASAAQAGCWISTL